VVAINSGTKPAATLRGQADCRRVGEAAGTFKYVERQRSRMLPYGPGRTQVCWTKFWRPPRADTHLEGTCAGHFLGLASKRPLGELFRVTGRDALRIW
jgi:hypothetical protein